MQTQIMIKNQIIIQKVFEFKFHRKSQKNGEDF